MSAELRAVGVDLSFAPVLDLDAGISEVIGDRAFHIQPQAVAALAGAYAKGMAEAGMAACGKHFPGHGNVAGDSHLQLPVDTREMETIGAADLIPFRASITAGIPALMMAHVRYEGVDPEPASLSAHWIRGILRGEFAFNGVVFCDDLSMNGAAAAGSYFERATLALRAGCDVLPVCNNRAAVAELLDTDLPAPPSGPAHWNRLFGRKAPNWDGLHNSELWGKSVQTLGVV
jgi:beta-N-acetylhexosaminidase